ncbi:MAG: sel1 repeat family protein [Bacteroidetes bacterium]|nr:sel1 repeat family protein [Bacteroidota bacterium]MCW5895009.1 sel1 repeat family protein [Bacteroidota bacterium]
MIFEKTSVVVVALAASSALAFSQSDRKANPNSPVFKHYRPPTTAPILEQSDATYQMWQGFQVMQKANAGDAVSQFELSIRYLTGRGFKADTTKAAYWSQRAADRNHLLARYNLGIFKFNGWGTEWNPFEAYRDFRFAAERNLPEAQFVLAQFFTENLVVAQDWNEAYRWVKLAADSGYAPAKESLKEFEKRGIRPPADSANRQTSDGTVTQRTSSSGGIQLQFLNFSQDTIKAPSDSVLFEDAVKAAMLSNDKSVQRIFGSLNGGANRFELDTAAFRLLEQSAEAGSPEALTLLARSYDRGVHAHKDIIRAAFFYIRAIRLDSPRSSRLLFDLIQRREFFDLLRQRVNRNDAEALYVWACLIALGYDRQLTEAQAFQMLERAVAQNHSQAMIELGLCYYSGRWTSRDESKADEMWRRAARLGNAEATVRRAVMNIRSGSDDLATSIPILSNVAASGSVLAEVALGYCFETGTGVTKSVSEAARLYRSSAQRGSQDAYRALYRLHDAIRPQGNEFVIRD